MSEHALLGASGAYRWMTCPGSINLGSTLPPLPDTPAAQEGTAAHEAAALCLNEGMNTDALIGRFFNKVEITEEIATSLQTYVDYIRELVVSMPESSLFVEKRFDLTWLRPNMFGTNDVCVTRYADHLYVVDLKFGQGIIVEVENNRQLLYYALGALQTLGDANDEVTMVIVQPRAHHKNGPIRTWTVSAKYIREWAQELGIAADKTLELDAPRVPGDHCKWCNAAGAMCPEYTEYVVEEARMDFAEPYKELPVPTQDQLADLTRALKALPRVRQWCNAVEATGLEYANIGLNVKDFKVVRGSAHRQWMDENDVIKELITLKIPKKTYLSEPKLLSPAKLEKVKAVGKEFVKKHYYSPQGKLKLVPEVDDRPSELPPAVSDFKDTPLIEDDLLK